MRQASALEMASVARGLVAAFDAAGQDSFSGILGVELELAVERIVREEGDLSLILDRLSLLLADFSALVVAGVGLAKRAGVEIDLRGFLDVCERQQITF
jgi:hypothetical protein